MVKFVKNIVKAGITAAVVAGAASLAYHFVAGRLPLKILSVSNGFLRDSFPHTEEYQL